MWNNVYNVKRLTVTRKILRNEPTKYEKILWEKLKWKNFEWLKFRRQHSIWRYIIDFYCNSLKLWIEVDWWIHLEEKNIEYDKIREEFLTSWWIKIIRFTNQQLENDIDSVLEILKKYT